MKKGPIAIYLLSLLMMFFLAGCGGSDGSNNSTNPPPQVGLLAVTPADSQLTVTWTAVIGATSYEVYYNTTSDSSTAISFNGDSNAADTTCIITGLANGTTYYVWARAANSAGSSSFNAASSPVTPIATVAAPSAPVLLAVTAGDTQLAVTWSAVTGATSYKVYYNTTNNSSTASEFTGDSNAADTTCIITGLANGTPYYVWAKAINSAGSSNFSAASAPSTPGSQSVPNTALFNQPFGITTDGTSLYVADTFNHTIRKIVISTGVTTTLAGSASADGSADGTGVAARFSQPRGIVRLGTNLYVADSVNDTIRKIDISSGTVTTLAGMAGFAGGADGTGSAARFHYPCGITTDGTDLYIADTYASTIRKVTEAGVVTTVAGTFQAHGFANDTGPAASFRHPYGITSVGGSLYVADTGNYIIRKIDMSNRAVTTWAGSAGDRDAADGIGPVARFDQIYGLFNDGTNLYVADTFNHTIRKIDISTVAVTTLAGFAGRWGSDDGTGTVARFDLPMGLTAIGSDLYVTDSNNHTVRKVVISTGAVTTVAGTAKTSGSTN
jgi:hypothetical protein